MDRVPTLGEYAELIEWLVNNVNDEIPKHLREIYIDALDRAAMRRFARSMEDGLDATRYAYGLRSVPTDES